MRRPLYILYFLLLYALAELVWWGFLMVKLDPERVGMIISEGSVLLFVLCFGAIRMRQLMNKEKEMYQQQKNFLLSVTHEFKSPMASIKLYLQTILKRDLEASKQREFIGNALKDVERLDDLVENMLIATKIENHSYSFPKENFDVSELVAGIVSRIQQNQQGKRKVLAYIKEDIELYGDRFALSLAVSNLIENAIKYSKEKDKITVKLAHDAEEITLTVMDEGIGIDDKQKDLVFKKFYRVGNEETRRTKGTGLGLFIVKQVLDNHSAVIWVTDNKPKGTVFKVVFNKDW